MRHFDLPTAKALHPAAHTPEFNAWRNMLYRCLDRYHQHWPRYGGLGIKVYEPWRDFDAFLRDMGRRPEGCVLARKDTSGDFTPENCQWERREEAARRYRSTWTISYNGETLLLSEWSARTGLPAARIRMRMTTLGWPVGQALGLEPRSTLPQKTENNFPSLRL